MGGNIGDRAPESYLGCGRIAQAMGVSRHAVHKWRARFPAHGPNPFPSPDVEVDGTPGWRPERMDELVRWRESLPGRGSGGGRPPASRRAYFAAAAARGMTPDEAQRTLDNLLDEFPEKTERDIHAWLVESWSDTTTSPVAPASENVSWFTGPR